MIRFLILSSAHCTPGGYNQGVGTIAFLLLLSIQPVREWRVANEAKILAELRDLLAIPNVASDTPNIERNAAALSEMLRRRGIEPRLLRVEGAPPVVFGELRTPGAKETLVLYAHYDGQPVDRARWASDPWTPVVRTDLVERGGKEVAATGKLDPEWRVFARSASDDKAPIVAMLAALDALRATKTTLRVNVKFFFEGEEEAGSPHLGAILEKYKDLLAADLWLIADGPVHQSRRLQLYYGVRGVMGLELTTYGPARPLHSGHYGNWAPNPLVTLTHLLASLRDEEGHILIDGFYDDVRPLTAAERAAVAEVPAVDEQLKRELALGRTEGASGIAGAASVVERITVPALNVRGIRGGGVGETAANVISPEAAASIDFRLVPDQTPERVREKVERHLRARGFHIVHETPSAEIRRAHAKVVKLEWESGYPASRVAMDHPAAASVERRIESALGQQLIKLPTLGGSVPLYLFPTALGIPIVNHDNNQHGANENVRLQNLWDGIEVFAAVLAGD
jgi:acetylornithine deacetylase/succinyl-diaminopimelate desuccinylase-like protein